MPWFMTHDIVSRVIFPFFSRVTIGTKMGRKFCNTTLAWKRRRECGVDAFVVQFARQWILFSFGVAHYRCRNGLDVLESVWGLVIVCSTRFEYALVHRSLHIPTPLECLATMKVVEIPLKERPELFRTTRIVPELAFMRLNVPRE